MTVAPVELADVIRRYGAAFVESCGKRMSRQQWRVFNAITACRTAALGGRKYRCADCAQECYVYNPCRNRHCPKCQAKARADWTNAREAELLPIPYFHVVFTLPQQLALIGLQNQRVVYEILFQSASRTLQVLSADPKHLGARIGILAVLHTWGQTLVAHPHVHCVVTGGGISPDGQRWISCKQSKNNKSHFFIHVNVLSSFFRRRFIRSLNRAYRNGELCFQGKTAHLSDPAEFKRWVNALPGKWNVYVKRPFRRTKRLVRYLARYTHRVAISNERIQSMEDGQVVFGYKDYRDGGRQKTMRLTAIQFIARFMMHVLPSRFMRIRHYGFLSNRCRTEQLELCRRLLGMKESPTDAEETVGQADVDATERERCLRCPACKSGKLLVVDVILNRWIEYCRSPAMSHERGPPLQTTA